MSNNTVSPVGVDSTLFQKYAPALFSALVALGGGLTGLQAVGLSPTSVLQFVVLVASTILVFLLPLVPVKWNGLVKTGVEIVSVLATAGIPFFANGGHIDKSQYVLVGVAVLKALATEFGVQIRTDSTITSVVPAQTFNFAGEPLPNVAPPAVFDVQPNEVVPMPTPTPEPEPEPLPEVAPEPVPDEVKDEPAQKVRVPRPAPSALRPKWVEFAEQFGYDDEKSKLTKAALISKYGRRRA